VTSKVSVHGEGHRVTLNAKQAQRQSGYSSSCTKPIPFEDQPWSLAHAPPAKLKSIWPHISKEEVCSFIVIALQYTSGADLLALLIDSQTLQRSFAMAMHCDQQ
jgi:hypothetical protein